MTTVAAPSGRAYFCTVLEAGMNVVTLLKFVLEDIVKSWTRAGKGDTERVQFNLKTRETKFFLMGWTGA